MVSMRLEESAATLRKQHACKDALSPSAGEKSSVMKLARGLFDKSLR